MFLENEPILYADMIGIQKRKTAKTVWRSETSLLLYDQGLYFMAGASQADYAAMVKLLHDPHQVVVHQAQFAPIVEAATGLKATLTCLQAVFKGEVKATAGLERLRLLPRHDLVQVANNYAMVNEAYLTERLAAGELFGCYRIDQLVGFAGFHEEGSIGMVAVFPEFRRQGIATFMEGELIRMVQARGEQPFIQTLPDNLAAIRFHEAIGFQYDPRVITWVN